MSSSEVIHANVFNPCRALFKQPASTQAEVNYITCHNFQNCGLNKRGECSLIGIKCTPCSYGKRHRKYGPTKRSRNFTNWILSQQEEYKDVPRLDSVRDVMAIVGDYVFLPYNLMNIEKAVEGSREVDVFSKSIMVPIAEFTPSIVVALTQYTPRSLLGGIITSYQEEVVPKFCRHLQETMPSLFDQAVTLCPNIVDKADKYTKVGRKVKLFSTVPNKGKFTDIHGDLWTWDGEYLTSHTQRPAFGLAKKVSEVRVKPSEDVDVVVTCDEQVNANTIFVS
jgi:hypothetical protein